MVEERETNHSGAFSIVQDTKGVHFEKNPVVEPTGSASGPEPDKMKSKRDLEMEMGKRRVAEAAKEIANRPPRIISEAERKATGTNVPLFRPNMLGIDRVNSGLGPLMRKVGGTPTPQQ